MLVILLAVALPAPSHAGLRAGVTLVGTRDGRTGQFGARGALLVEGAQELTTAVTVYGKAPLLLSWNVQTLSFTDLGLHCERSPRSA